MALHGDDTGRGDSLDSVLGELKRGASAPCYLLFGDEEFLLKNALEKITTALIPDSRDRELNLFVLDGEREDVDGLCESLITPPLLPGRKVIVVRDTRLFQSKNVLAPLIGRIRERLAADPGRAAADFRQFLTITGLQLDDLRDGGWKKIDDDTWKRIVPDDGGAGRETWLPQALELAESFPAPGGKERQDETDRLERTLTEGMPAENVLILTAEAVDRRKKLYKTIAQAGRILTFTKAKGETRQQQALREMAAESLAGSGKRLSADAWSALGRKTGFDLRESLGAIEMLVTYTGARPQIEAADVEELIGKTKEDTVFALTAALSGRSLTAALKSLHELIGQGEPPLRVFAMIVNEIRFLFQAKILIASGLLKAYRPEVDYPRFQKTVYPALRKLADDGKETIALCSQHPYVIYQALRNAGRFSREELAGYLPVLLETDLALKSTGKDPILLLERFLMKVCGKG